MTDIFRDILPSIMKTKQKCVLAQENEYVPFLVNRALSFHYDCALLANEMNKLPGLDQNLQYDYLLNTVRAYRRPFKGWIKKETIENLAVIQEYYQCSSEKAKEIISILSPQQIEELKKRIYKGGVNDKHKRTNRGET